MKKVWEIWPSILILVPVFVLLLWVRKILAAVFGFLYATNAFPFSKIPITGKSHSSFVKIKGNELPAKVSYLSPQTTDTQRSLFSSKSQTFGLRQRIWADNLWGIWGIFGQFMSTHFGTVSPFSACFPLINHYFWKN